MVCKPKAADKTVYDAEFSFRRSCPRRGLRRKYLNNPRLHR